MFAGRSAQEAKKTTRPAETFTNVPAAPVCVPDRGLSAVVSRGPVTHPPWTGAPARGWGSTASLEVPLRRLANSSATPSTACSGAPGEPLRYVKQKMSRTDEIKKEFAP
jgi:hypothetical protein